MRTENRLCGLDGIVRGRDRTVGDAERVRSRLPCTLRRLRARLARCAPGGGTRSTAGDRAVEHACEVDTNRVFRHLEQPLEVAHGLAGNLRGAVGRNHRHGLDRANRLRVGDPTDPNTQVGALISKQHWEKVSGYIRLGIEEGATLLAGGADKPSDLPAHLKAGNFLRPTVLADVDNRMRVAQEEIFGPVACLLPFKDEAEGLRLANDVEYGLASYIWTQDVSKVLRLARGIEAGMVFVNTQNVRDLRQPFGGVKASGTGREGGEYSFEVFAEMKNVCISMGDHPIPKWGV